MSMQEKLIYDNRIKRKHILALNEKIAAIRCYERNPSYKSVGRHFNCSPDQIKRIILQKEEVIKAWSMRTKKPNDIQPHDMKSVQVSILGKAVYEWIKRMMYYKDFNITDGLIQKMALQFKSILTLQSFFPHQEWVENFRSAYNIFEKDTKKLNIGYTEGFSVQLKDIIRDLVTKCPENVGKAIKNADDQFATKAPQFFSVTPTIGASPRPPFAMTYIPMTAVTLPSSSPQQQLPLVQAQEPVVTIKKEFHIKTEVISDDEEMANDGEDEQQKQSPVRSSPKLPSQSPSPSTSPLPLRTPPSPTPTHRTPTPKVSNSAGSDFSNTIRTAAEARKYLKLLEDFALLKENFRLIGLLTRADEVLREMDGSDDDVDIE